MTKEQAKEMIGNARALIESFDDTPAMTIGFDKESYSLTGDQMLTIAAALYAADCHIEDE